MKKAISIEGLSFDYGKDQVLKNINVGFSKGKFSIILGKNGSGKSTLFKVIAGLEKKYKGQIWVGDKERKKIKIGNIEAVRLGFMTQFHQTTFPFKVFDVILTGRASFSKFSPNPSDYQVVEEIIEKFHLSRLKNKPYTSLSGGERQLVLLCRVLVQKPDILMLDEPTNHLDVQYQVLVLECLRQLVKEGTTVLCVMHDPNLAFMFGDEFYIMNNHGLVAVESHSTNQVRQLLEDTYGLPLLSLENQGKPLFVPQLK